MLQKQSQQYWTLDEYRLVLLTCPWWCVCVQVSCGTSRPKTIWRRNWPGRRCLSWLRRSSSPCQEVETLWTSICPPLRPTSSTTPQDASGELPPACVSCLWLLCATSLNYILPFFSVWLHLHMTIFPGRTLPVQPTAFFSPSLTTPIQPNSSATPASVLLVLLCVCTGCVFFFYSIFLFYLFFITD